LFTVGMWRKPVPPSALRGSFKTFQVSPVPGGRPGHSESEAGLVTADYRNARAFSTREKRALLRVFIDCRFWALSPSERFRPSASLLMVCERPQKRSLLSRTECGVSRIASIWRFNFAVGDGSFGNGNRRAGCPDAIPGTAVWITVHSTAPVHRVPPIPPILPTVDSCQCS
jgi:hypothetical protein